ncbi:hypothetical protein RUND412_007498, partial [Rhizina undulata]
MPIAFGLTSIFWIDAEDLSRITDSARKIVEQLVVHYAKKLVILLPVRNGVIGEVPGCLGICSSLWGLLLLRILDRCRRFVPYNRQRMQNCRATCDSKEAGYSARNGGYRGSPGLPWNMLIVMGIVTLPYSGSMPKICP